MYTPATLLPCLAPLLGFRQSPEGSPDEPQLLPELLAAAGAVAMQDVHPLLSLANIRLAAPQVPAAGADIGAQLSAYLVQARTAAAAKVLTAFTERKKLTDAGRSVLQDAKLTGQSGAYRDKIIKQGRFVGLSLQQPDTARDVRLRITAVGTQFTEVNPEFRLWLYQAGQMAPVASYELPRTSSTYFEFTPLAIELPAGPEYRLGYFEDDLVGQAIRLDNNFSQRPCQSCNSDYLHFDKWAPYARVRAFSTPAPVDGTEWAWPVPTYQTDSNWGLNLQLSATCDLSAYFCRHKELFATCLQKQLAVDLLTLMANSTRNNGISQQTRSLALLELNNRPDQPGLLTQLATALAALDVDLSGVSRPCLPCAKGNGVKVGTI